IYSAQGRYKEAEEIAVVALDRQREILGKEHPDTLLSMHNLACTWIELGRHSSALTLIEECVQYRRSVLWPEHPYTVESTKLLER
ncbi:hypothetical protein CI102_4817, partial [Trichoderma harzianum]